MSSTKYNIRTEGPIIYNTIHWTMPKFKNLLDNNTTREFCTEKSEYLTEPRFQLKMQFFGRDNDIIEMYYLTPKPVLLQSVLTIYYKNSDRRLRFQDYQHVKANEWQFLTKLFKHDITTYDEPNKLLRNDGSLQLKFEFLVKITNDVKVERSHVPEVQLSNDFEYLLNNGLFSDVIMKSAEGVDYKVHKAVLASRSAVLKAHFEHNTTECHTNIVESPLESEVLKEVLTFIYSEKVPRVDEIPEKLLVGADYYQLNRLKSLCEEVLYKKLTVENAIETLQLADLHSAETLKLLTLKFIKDGQAKLIINTEGWAKVKSVDLIKRIYEYILADEVGAEIK